MIYFIFFITKCEFFVRSLFPDKFLSGFFTLFPNGKNASGIFIRTDFRKISEFVRDLRICPMLFPQFLNKSFERMNLLLNFAISKLNKENKKQNINN